MHLHLPVSASRRFAGALRSTAKRPGRARSLAGLLASLVLLGSFAAAAIVSASTPVTVGFKDFGYGGGASRATGDKPQSKLWYAGGTWWAGLFVYDTAPTPDVSEYRIHRLDGTSWTLTSVKVDGRDQSHADYYFDSAANKLYVLSAGQPVAGCAPTTSDDLQLYRYSFSGSAYTLDGGFPVVLDTCGSYTATIAKDSVGTLWAAYPQGVDVKVAHSVSDGMVGTFTDETTWAAPYRLPVQATDLNPGGPGVDPDITAVVAFGSNKIGVAWSNHSAAPATISFAVHADGGADDAAAWGTTSETALATNADDHLNVKTDPDGNVWIVTKTSLDGDPIKTKPLIELLQRSSGGAWTTHLVSTVADLDTRPQLLISDTTPRVAYVLMSAPNGGGSAYYKSAPINSVVASENLKFAMGDATTSMPGVPFISSLVETKIDDVTTTKQNITATTGLVAEATDLTKKVYLHNFLSIASSDTVDPIGTVSLNAAAPTTGNPLVSVAVPATDAGSGVSQVRISNSPTLSAGVLSTGTTFAYTTPVAWTLPAGDGTKTVYAQWRDGAGNWSAVASDTITLDTAKPSGTVTINGGAALTNSLTVSLALTADGTGSAVSTVSMSNSADMFGATSQAFAASVPWTLATGADGTRTVYVQYTDAAGNISDAGAISDAIVLDTTPPATGTVTIGGGPVVSSLNVTLTLAGAGGDATAARVSNSADMSGAAAISLAGGSWTLAAGPDGPRTVYAEWADALGNWSAAVASNTVTLDTAKPSGTVTINGGAALTNSLTVSLGVPASDASGVSQVRISNSPTLSAGVLSTGTTFAYTTPVAWTLPAGDGTKTVYAQWRDGAGNWSAVASDTITLDTAKPSGTVTINGGAVATRSTSVSIAVPASDASGVSQVRLSNDPTMAGAVTRSYATPQSWTLAAGADGTRTVYVQWKDTAGNWSAVASDSIVLDTTPPTVTAPVQALVTGATLGTSSVPVRLTWTGTDTGSGIGHFELAQSTNGGTYAAIALASPTATSITRSLTPGANTYRFRVRAVDAAGNVSAWAYGPTFHVNLIQESSTLLTYTGTWYTATLTSASGGQLRYTTQSGASVSTTFTGRNVAWVAPRGPTRGSAKVYLDGVYIKTVSLYATTYSARRIVFSKAWSTSATHTLKIVNLATAGHPRIDLDAIVVLR